MKRKILLVLFFCVILVSLTGCKTKNINDTFNTYYTTESETLNYLVSSYTKDSQFFADCVDGLLENDRFGNLTPALATSTGSERTNADGDQVWTFEIRSNAIWVDAKGEKYADVMAQDWVAAAQYILTPANNSGLVSMWFQMIKGAEAYYNAKLAVTEGTATDDQRILAAKPVQEACGISANGRTLTFTCDGVIPYFNTVLTYNSFYPVNSEFLLEAGTSFGDTYNDILYCGGYLITQRSYQSQTVLVKNDSYWDADHVYIKTINWKFVASTTYSTTRELYEAGDIDGFNIANKNDLEGYNKYVAGPDGTGTIDNPYYENAYVATAQGTGIYYATFNYERAANPTNVTKDDSKGMFLYTTHTTASYNNTHKAIQNLNFRKMFTYGINWIQYIEDLYTGEGLGLTYSTKGWTINGLCSAGGKDYTYYVAEQFAKANSLDVNHVYANFDNSATEDIVYNLTKARQFAQTAYNELSAQGVTFPIKIETWGDQDAEAQSITEETCKAIEAALTINGTKLVEFYVFQPKTPQEQNQCFYFGNYDFTFSSGWGADYADPLTFLNCHVIDGDMFDILGFTDKDSVIANQILGTYTAKVKAANAITNPDKIVDRYKAFAEAEYYLIYDQSIIFPYLHASANRVTISKVLPYTNLRGSAGISSAKNKYKVVSVSLVTQNQKDKLREAWIAGNKEQMEKVISDIQSNKLK